MYLKNKELKEITKPYLIKGNSNSDHRGKISFVNDFNLLNSQRFYVISHKEKLTIRAWQGHKIEQKCFYVLHGEFNINLAEIDNWNSPSCTADILSFKLGAINNEVLIIPPGFANGIINIVENSELLVFSNLTLSDSKLDDYRFNADYFINCNWKL